MSYFASVNFRRYEESINTFFSSQKRCHDAFKRRKIDALRTQSKILIEAYINSRTGMVSRYITALFRNQSITQAKISMANQLLILFNKPKLNPTHCLKRIVFFLHEDALINHSKKSSFAQVLREIHRKVNQIKALLPTTAKPIKKRNTNIEL